MSAALLELLERERCAAEAALARTLDDLLSGAPEPLAATIRYAVEGGGKRLRPILCAASFRAAGGPAEDTAVYDMAAGLELIHAYSLVHDDLPCMDDDDVRRGRPATHRAKGEAAAVLAGAALIPLACRAVSRGGELLGLTGSVRMALVRELCAAAGALGMVGGQLLDLEAEGRRLPVAELERVHRLKTGALLAASVRMGGIAAGAAARELDALSRYGHALGLAFQIADDVLDVTAESAILGKPAGSDSGLAKSTYAALLGVDGARDRARAEAADAIATLRRAGLESPELESLAAYAVERER